jgi:glycosyltransferase involved in cell wall biosynthesis
MKWNWFCPLPPAKTGIADYAVKILPFLQAHAEITLWTDQEEWKPSVGHHGQVRTYDLASVSWSELNRADLNIYHIGNNPDFHGAIWQMARRCPGLVVLHEPSLHHFFGTLYRDRWKARSAYLELMQRHYGEASLEFMAEHFPLTWHGLENALGVVVHSYKVFSELKAAERLPAAYIPLPYPPKDFARRSGKAGRNDVIHIIMFGFLGRNRRWEPILQAIANLKDRHRIRLAICGTVLDLKEMSSLIDWLNLGEIVSLRGFVPEEDLDQMLAHSDMALNLGYPSMGEASFSQLRIWEHALPAMVTRVGWYATLPEDVVCFVRPEHEIEDIQKHLNALLDDPENFEEMGRRGRALLESNHTPAAYARTLSEFATAIHHSTIISVDHLVNRIGTITGEWLGKIVDPTPIVNASRQILAVTGNE